MGRYILDAIIGLWEGIEYAKESGQGYCFLKIDFDKAYDRLEWDFVVLALQCAGFVQNFIAQILTLFGNARARISINGALSPTLCLKRAIRQGCPLAPLLYAIATDGLSWLVEDRISKHRIESIKLPQSSKQMCLQLFVDDMNALVANKEASLKEFWNCLQIFCVASGSKINHSKTGIKTHGKSIPEWMLQQGCQPIIEGEIFRLLGIPMGFKISLQQRWNWVLFKISGKLNR